MRLGGIRLVAVFGLLTVAANPARAQGADFDACLGFSFAACDRVLTAQPDNLTALFMRGLSGIMSEAQQESLLLHNSPVPMFVADHSGSLADMQAVVAREPRHFGAQLWCYILLSWAGKDGSAELRAYLATAESLGVWPRVLAELYLGDVDANAVLEAAHGQGTAEKESLSAAYFHIAMVSRDDDFRKSLAKAVEYGSLNIFEYRAAAFTLNHIKLWQSQ